MFPAIIVVKNGVNKCLLDMFVDMWCFMFRGKNDCTVFVVRILNVSFMFINRVWNKLNIISAPYASDNYNLNHARLVESGGVCLK